ncbi:MAG TPA: glycosyltransferase family 4 protein [Sedimentisphaerales bacterium]|nr:glycosyltransferase family 4 protein [Sedimentisphaerales bacterium]
MSITTLMLGWEFPPFISGGLGTACYGLTRAMSGQGMQVIFVLPRQKPIRFPEKPRVPPKILAPEMANVRIRSIQSPLTAYGKFGPAPSRPITAAIEAELSDTPARTPTLYGPSLETEVFRYAQEVVKIAQHETFDVIHAHDWMTFPAGIALAACSGKPLVVQIHSTEFDRTGEHVNQFVYDIERQGMHAAARVITVSNYTRKIVVTRYGVPPVKVDVVYNGVEPAVGPAGISPPALSKRTDKTVLFVGRITMQKGPEYFLYAAKKVLEKIANVRFIMAGDGDRLHGIIELAAWLGIGHRVFFTRFLGSQDIQRVYRMADLYVMPSVSEPFGIAPLEALQNDVPVLISKQSGLAETLRNALKVDFWDVVEMANKIIAVLRHRPLADMLRINGREETRRFRWEDSAAKISQIYRQVLNVA